MWSAENDWRGWFRTVCWESCELTARKFRFLFCILQAFSTDSLRLVDGTTGCEFVASRGYFVGKWNNRNRAELTGTRTGEYKVLVVCWLSAVQLRSYLWQLVNYRRRSIPWKTSIHPNTYISNNSEQALLNAVKSSRNRNQSFHCKLSLYKFTKLPSTCSRSLNISILWSPAEENKTFLHISIS